MSINALPSDTFIGIASFSFPGSELKQNEMSLLSMVCSLWRNQFVYEICSRQLGKKTALTLREVEIYQKRLRSTPDDWDCVFKHCKALKEVDFSFPENNWKRGQMRLLQERDFEPVFNSITMNCFNLQSINLYKNPTINKCIEVNFVNLASLKDNEVSQGYTLSCDKVLGLLKQFPHLGCLNITGHLTWEEYALVKEEFPKTCISLVKINVAFPPVLKIRHKTDIEFDQNDNLTEIKEEILDRFWRYTAPHSTINVQGSADLVILKDEHEVEITNKSQLQERIDKYCHFSVDFKESPSSFFNKKLNESNK